MEKKQLPKLVAGVDAANSSHILFGGQTSREWKAESVLSK